MVKKNVYDLVLNKNSIYYDLKEFHDRNPGILYSYQDFEIAGIREYKSITNKIRPLEIFEKNRLANELLDILYNDLNFEEKIVNINGFITLNPIINYYESLVKLFRASIYSNEGLLDKMREVISKILKNSSNGEEIKLAIVLSTVCNIENIESILSVFSIHNDYLFYVIYAYEYMGECNDKVFQISKISRGYGKVFCVMNLSPTNDEIRKWLIEYGCENNVGVSELLSYTMLSLDLIKYLEDIGLNKEKLDIFSKSFSVLLSDYGIDDIKNSIKVCNKLLEIIDSINGKIYSLYAVISILYSIEAIIIDEYKNKKEAISYKFNNDYKSIIEKCKRICKKNIWHEIIASEVSNIEIESSVLISCAEKTKYRLKKREYEIILKRDCTNALLYKYAFSVGSKAIKKCAFDLALQKLPMDQIFRGQDELKIETLAYDDIAQICVFIIIKYSQYEEFPEKYKELNLQALRSPLIETRIQAAVNLQRFRSEFDSDDKEIINDAISSEMVAHVRRSLNSLLIESSEKEKRYVGVNENMHIDIHVKDIYLINLNIAGTIYVDMSEIYNKLLEEDIVYFHLTREYNNQHDQNDIQVITTEGYVIGYVPRDNSTIMKNLMDKGKYLYGKINELSEDYNNININIYLSYKDVIEEVTNTLSLLSGEREYYLQ
ncbi:DNA-binding protein [Clostridium chromiireducens]|uniref:DNA-binding protein n=1 Tax=Clostridium chromiireducens TaxID=225345 RepID=A0A399IN97_9CLOT|nr:HIRAN domain-containing protein [Clostridium chromiireducens]RII34574.1 DNA-binding protein [Clostridium chromiireducens]